MKNQEEFFKLQKKVKSEVLSKFEFNCISQAFSDTRWYEKYLVFDEAKSPKIIIVEMIVTEYQKEYFVYSAILEIDPIKIIEQLKK